MLRSSTQPARTPVAQRSPYPTGGVWVTKMSVPTGICKSESKFHPHRRGDSRILIKALPRSTFLGTLCPWEGWKPIRSTLCGDSIGFKNHQKMGPNGFLENTCVWIAWMSILPTQKLPKIVPENSPKCLLNCLPGCQGVPYTFNPSTEVAESSR